MFLDSDCLFQFALKYLRIFKALDRWDPEPAVEGSWPGTAQGPRSHSGQTPPAENTGCPRSPPVPTARDMRGSLWKSAPRCWTDNPNSTPLSFYYSVRQLHAKQNRF